MVDRRRASTLSLIALVFVYSFGAGCATPKLMSPAQTRAALGALNARYAALDGAVYGEGLISVRFRDEMGRTQQAIAQPTTLIFEAPRCLYLDVKSSIAGTFARLGANDERYWLWVDSPDMRKLYWGTWDALAAGRARSLPVPPDQLLDALLLRPHPDRLPGSVRATGWETLSGVDLVFLAEDSLGWPYERRVLRIPQPPIGEPSEIVDYDAEGRELLRATLRAYRPMADGTTAAWRYAHSYVLSWPTLGAEIRLDLNSLKRRTNDLPFCDFPRRFNGQIEALDEIPGDANDDGSIGAGA